MCPGRWTKYALSMFVCIMTRVFPSAFWEDGLYFSIHGRKLLDLLPSRGVTAQTWTDTCSAKGFEILVIARVGRRRSSCQMHWATSSLFWMFLILIRVHRLFNCSVDVLSANWWMILHFTELNVNPHLTNPHVTKQYVYSFSTKALIFIMKMRVPTPTWQVLAFWKFLVHKMHSRTGGNENRVYIFCPMGKWMNGWCEKTIFQNEGYRLIQQCC